MKFETEKWIENREEIIVKLSEEEANLFMNLIEILKNARGIPDDSWIYDRDNNKEFVDLHIDIFGRLYKKMTPKAVEGMFVHLDINSRTVINNKLKVD